MSMTSTKVEIPADVRDNSETVTDYAYRRHLSPDKGVRTPQQRNTTLAYALPEDRAYDIHTWYDVNPDGQRCRFDMITQDDGRVVHLFHTEYFTRVPCANCDYSYAGRFVQYADAPEGYHPIPLCGGHLGIERRAARYDGRTLLESEPLHIGQH